MAEPFAKNSTCGRGALHHGFVPPKPHLTVLPHAGPGASIQEVASLERTGDTASHNLGGLLGRIPEEAGPAELRPLDEHHPPCVPPRAQDPRAPAATESG